MHQCLRVSVKLLNAYGMRVGDRAFQGVSKVQIIRLSTWPPHYSTSSFAEAVSTADRLTTRDRSTRAHDIKWNRIINGEHNERAH